MPNMSDAHKALLRSQSGPCSGKVFGVFPTSDILRVPADELRVLLLRRLRSRIRLTESTCRCRRSLDSFGDHRAACANAGVLKRRGVPLEKAAARICREAGARVQENVLVRELNLDDIPAGDARQLEVVANGLPLYNGSQLAIDTTLISPLRRWITSSESRSG